MKKLVIIDGKSVFYRGYYAMGNLATSDGTPTSGVYGFAVIATEIVRKLQPTKVVVAWDKAGTSVAKRKAIYAEYKAGRVKPPEDFFAQIPLLKELVAALGWGFLECDNYEADDIIGTLAKQASETADDESGYYTYVISSDLDMLQVVNERVEMYRLIKGFSQIEEVDVPAVEAKYGIKKAQFLDLKALKGDSSDNIPGVPGIGEKGAVKLLNSYGTLDGIYAHLDEIKGAVHDKLAAGKELAYMSYELAKIMTDAPVRLDQVPELVIEPERVLDALKKLEFSSLIRKFGDILSKGSSDAVAVSPTASARPVVTGARRFSSAVASARSETTATASEDAAETTTEAHSTGETTADPEVLVAWDVKQMMHENHAVAERILKGEKYWDLSQGAFLLNPLARGYNTEVSPREEYQRQRQELEKMPRLMKVYKNLDLPLIPVLYRMETRGIKIDREYFAKLKTEYEGEVRRLEQKVWELAGGAFNVNSPLQLAGVLYERLGLPTKGIKKTARGYSTGAKELEKLHGLHPVVPAILEYREASKLLSTYILPLPDLADAEGRVHTTFTQNVTATGRLSSVNPNLQNIPVRTEEGRRIRTGFVAGEGKRLVSADYAQFELRLAAVLAGDQGLIADFNSGIDIHTKTAADVFGVPVDQVTKTQRRAAKVINFGVLYGMSAKGLSEAAGMNIMEAKRFIDDYFAVRRPIREYLDAILRQARSVGYVETYYGRRRPTPDVKSSNFLVRAAAERAAQNMPIQGTEADLMKRAMIQVQQRLPQGAEIVMQVHDSLIVECGEGLVDQVTEILQRTMEGVAPELAIRLAVEVTAGKNWGEL